MSYHSISDLCLVDEQDRRILFHDRICEKDCCVLAYSYQQENGKATGVEIDVRSS